jgi:hypothetical protein
MSTSLVSSTVTELSSAEAAAMFERRCHEELGVTAEEFLAAVDAGRIPDQWACDSVARLEMLLPFVR